MFSTKVIKGLQIIPRPIGSGRTQPPFISCQLAPRNLFQGLMWCKCGHVNPQTFDATKPATTEALRTVNILVSPE